MVHRVSMALATAGMVHADDFGPDHVVPRRLHKPVQAGARTPITGYATFAFMATGTIAYFFWEENKPMSPFRSSLV